MTSVQQAEEEENNREESKTRASKDNYFRIAVKPKLTPLASGSSVATGG